MAGIPCAESAGERGPIDDAGDPREESLDVRRAMMVGETLEVLGGLDEGRPTGGWARGGAEAGPGAGAAIGTSVEVEELFEVRIVGFEGLGYGEDSFETRYLEKKLVSMGTLDASFKSLAGLGLTQSGRNGGKDGDDRDVEDDDDWD